MPTSKKELIKHEINYKKAASNFQVWYKFFTGEECALLGIK